jgi:FHA domain
MIFTKEGSVLAYNYSVPERIVKRKLKVEFAESGELLGYIEGAHVYVGREPDHGGLVVPNQAVSRNHGVFIRLRNHWFYKDLGSTNGSWVNDVKTQEGQWKLIRPGDVVQLADTLLNIADSNEVGVTGFPALGGLSLIIFSKGEFIDEYPIPEYGRALVVGGSQGDLQIEGTLEEQPTLIIERRGMNVCALSVSRSLKVLVNNNELNEPLNIIDRDEIAVGSYLIIFNDPSLGRGSSEIRQVSAIDNASSSTPLERSTTGRVNIKEWGDSEEGTSFAAATRGQNYSEGSSGAQGVFGRKTSETFVSDATITMDTDEVEKHSVGLEMHPSMRYAINEEPVDESMSSLDEKIIFVIGIILLMGLVGLMLYWLLS